MAGGNWTAQNKVLPGVYTNFVGKGAKPTVGGTRGIVGLPIVLPWLPSGELITVYPEDAASFIADYGDYAVTLQEAIKNASKVFLYRLNSGAKATAVLGNLTCTAKYTGTFGNRLKVSIENVLGESGQFYVITWLNTEELERQKVSNASGLKNNAWIDFTSTGGGTLAINAGTSLTNGTDGTVTNSNYASFLSAMETQDFNAIACTTDTVETKNLFIAFANRLRDDEGKYIQVVVPDTLAGDFEGVISVKNGVYLEGGVYIDKVKATAYIAGATSATPLTESLTNAPYKGAVDVDQRYTLSQQEQLAKTGQMVFIPSSVGSNKVLIQKDINSLITFTEKKPYSFSKNKIIRIIDSIGTEIFTKGTLSFIGKTQNNKEGRDLFKAEILTYFRTLEGQGVIKEVAPEDITVKQGNLIDSVVVDYVVRPVDTMDVIYITIVVEG